jgi:hypothetical protein
VLSAEEQILYPYQYGWTYGGSGHWYPDPTLGGRRAQYRDKAFADERAMFSGPSFFTMFDFPLVEGKATQPFADVHSVVITRQTAKKFFGKIMFLTFLQLRHGTLAAGFPARLNQIHLRNKPEDTDADYLLLPLSKMHLYNADASDAGAQTVTIFSIIALLILVIACINYVNLSTARAMLRVCRASSAYWQRTSCGWCCLEF